MLNTLRLIFSLENAQRVNGLLYRLKQLPLFKKMLSGRQIYGSENLKTLGMVLSIIAEIFNLLFGKLLYFLLMIFLPLTLMQKISASLSSTQLFLNILFFLTIAGSFMIPLVCDASAATAHTMIQLLNMEAGRFASASVVYTSLRLIPGFLLFGLIFGFLCKVPWYLCLLIPLFVIGAKALRIFFYLRRYDRMLLRHSQKSPALPALTAAVVIISLLFAYVIPFLYVPSVLLLSIPMLGITAAGCACLPFILHYPHYYQLYLHLFRGESDQMNSMTEASVNAQRKNIAEDTSITSDRKGLEYFNELFIKRHSRILNRPVLITAAIIGIVFLITLLLMLLVSGLKLQMHSLLLEIYLYFPLLMYLTNRGRAFTEALFYNCDHSMLTYTFYREPRTILKLFRIRLRELVKLSLLTASAAALSVDLLLWFSGETADTSLYLLYPLSILSLSIFFSVHYLALYYLIQPYTEGLRLKSFTYQIIYFLTYYISYLLTRISCSALLFAVSSIAFSLIYSVLACILVYRKGSRTFRLKND